MQEQTSPHTGPPGRSQSTRALTRVRKLCLALPETTERLSHGAPSFFVRDKTTFVMFMNDHHRDGRLALWCAAPDGVQHMLIETEPERFFRPPYVGPRGWIGIRLDVRPDWQQIEGAIVDAYRTVAPRRLITQFESPAARLR